MLVARSGDYTVVMHFSEAMRTKLIMNTGGVVNAAVIDAVYHINHENNWKRQQSIKDQDKRNLFGVFDMQQKAFKNEQSKDIHKASQKKRRQTLNANAVKDLIGQLEDKNEKN